MSGLMLKRERYEEDCCTLMTWITRILPDTHAHTHLLYRVSSDLSSGPEWESVKVWRLSLRQADTSSAQPQATDASKHTQTHTHTHRHTHTHIDTHSHLSISHRYTATFGAHCCEKSSIHFDLRHLSLCALLELIHANEALTVIRKYTYDSSALLITSLQIIPPSDCICFSIERDLFCFWKAHLSFLRMYKDHLDR